MRKTCLLIILVGLAVSGSGSVPQMKGTLNGTLLDPTGAVISSTIVRLRWNDLGDETSWDGVKREHKAPKKKRDGRLYRRGGPLLGRAVSRGMGCFCVPRWFRSDLYGRVCRAGEVDGCGTPLSSTRADNTGVRRLLDKLNSDR
jgi:hypothetical protein